MIIRFFLFIIIVGALFIAWNYLPPQQRETLRYHLKKALWPLVIAALIAILLAVLALTTTIKVI